VWPLVTLVSLFVVRPHIGQLLSGAKIKLSIGGQIIETTLPVLQQIIEEQAGEVLSKEHKEYLSDLQHEGCKLYASGVIDSNERKILRPLRNNGLIQTIPRNSFLNEAKAIELSALGRLYLRAIDARPVIMTPNTAL
jgi:hypothetical protein